MYSLKILNKHKDGNINTPRLQIHTADQYKESKVENRLTDQCLYRIFFLIKKKTNKLIVN